MGDENRKIDFFGKIRPTTTHHNKGTGRRGSKFPNHKTSKIATKTIGPTRRVLQGTLLWGINKLYAI